MIKLSILKIKNLYPGASFQLQLQTILPGFSLCLVVAMAAKFVSEHYGGPTILYALLMGMSLNYLSLEGKCIQGIKFAATAILKLGIALLGARITFEQLLSLGFTPIIVVLAGVPATIFFAIICGKWLKLSTSQSVLSGAAVGICGASAALAVSAVLPQNKESEKQLIFTIIGVTALSTVAMIIYPLIVSALALNATDGGIFLGATIHDVAQVIGAGYMISDDAGDVATFTKLLRVAALVPVVVVISVIVAHKKLAPSNQPSTLPLPFFLLAFVIIVAVNSTFALPEALLSATTEFSRWCLIVAMVGLGMKASFQELAKLGWRPIVLLLLETVFLAGGVILWLCLNR